MCVNVLHAGANQEVKSSQLRAEHVMDYFRRGQILSCSARADWIVWMADKCVCV